VTAFLIAFFAFAILAAAWVAYDVITGQPEIMPVMKVAWVLITLYFGPVGLILYLTSCREPRPGTHDQWVAPMWKQAVGSTMHCVAGDAIGIVAAAAVISAVGGVAMIADYAIEYVAAFLFGWLVFQVAPARMMGQPLGPALRSAFSVELVSLTVMVMGMFPMMHALRGSGAEAIGPEDIAFWGTMSASIAVGFVFTYPVNWLLVAAGKKHGMGSMSTMGHGGQGHGGPPHVPMPDEPAGVAR
jgi:hypothetical protein